MRIRIVAAGFGGAFGFLLAWTQMTDPDVIRRMLLLEDAYLYIVMGCSVAVAFVGLRLLRAFRVRALVTRDPVAWATVRPSSRHLAGSILFGAGWGLSNSCPGPIAAQLGQGMLWSLCTIAGIAIGITVYGRLHAQVRRAALGQPRPTPVALLARLPYRRAV
jgi:uncharacterized protein